jgi:hypothetical protein
MLLSVTHRCSHARYCIVLIVAAGPGNSDKFLEETRVRILCGYDSLKVHTAQ